MSSLPAAPAPATPTPVSAPPITATATRPAAPARSVAKVPAKPTAAAPATTTPRPVAAPPAARPATPVAAASPAKAVSPWANLFREWPKGILQRGIVVTQQAETTPFRGFMLRDELVLLERVSPDSLGARFVVLTFDEIAGVKFTDPLKQDVFQEAGFTGKLSD